MTMSVPSINVGLGWVVRASDGSYVDRFEHAIDEEHASDDADKFQAYVNDVAKNSDVNVAAYRFGLDLSGVALVADSTVKEADGWAANHADLAPDDAKAAAARAELNQALDALGWDADPVDDPQWLVLVAYG